MSAQPPPYPAPHGLLVDKNVLITAAAGAGIGVATAKRCAEEGARLAICDTHERRLEETSQMLEKITGSKPVSVVCDVTDESQVQGFFKAAIDGLGHLDVVVNNAGLGGESSIVNMTDEAWSKVIDVTLTGTFRCLRAAMAHMIARKSGVIVNNASVLAWRAQENQAHYAAAKAGVMALTRTAAMEGAPHNVRVNAVSPSFALHPFLSKVISQEVLDDLISKEAFKRAAEPWEVANVIVFLASEYSSYMTGEIVSVSSQHP